MGRYKQTKNSSNTYWTQVIYKQPNGPTGPGSSVALAIELTLDSNDVSQSEIAVTQNVPIYFKWIMTYEYHVWFYSCLNGLEETPNQLSRYSFYLSDDTSVAIDNSGCDLTNLTSGAGPDTLSRESHEIETDFEFAESEQYYYLKYTPPLSGNMGFYIYGD